MEDRKAGRGSMRYRRAMWICLIVILVVGGAFVYRAVRRAAANSSGMSRKAIDLLRSLPYVGSIDIGENEKSGVLVHDPERSCPGYNLYSVRMLSTAVLIDNMGEVINSWTYSPSDHWSNCELLPNGDFLVIGADESPQSDSPSSRGISHELLYALRFNWQGQLLWKRRLCAHHDIELTPDGRLQMLTLLPRLIPEIHSEIKVQDNQIVLLDQDGMVIESLSIFDAVKGSAGIFPLQEVKPDEFAGSWEIDLFHCNSIEAMHHKHLLGKHAIYDLGNTLLCSRYQDMISVIDREKNEVIWAWGRGQISGPHDASVLENGNILLFDNGLGRGYSRVIELDPLTEEIVWEYKGDPPSTFYTTGRGSAQRLPNGNTLMAESDKGRAIEVTPQGEIVWEFISPHKLKRNKRAVIVRMKRYPVEFVSGIIDSQEE